MKLSTMMLGLVFVLLLSGCVRLTDANNKEVSETGRPYHLFDLNFTNIETADLNTLKAFEYGIGRNGVGVLYENYSDRQVAILVERVEDFPELETSLGWHDNILKLKEKV